MINYYHILGLNESATAEEIRSAFKKLAVLYHPDKNPDKPHMEERFKEINEAYQTLSNPYQKARYDLMRSYGSTQPNPNYTYPEQPRPRPTYQRTYSQPKVDYKENWKATLYAFGFTFIVALVVMSVIGLKKYYDSIKESERQAIRVETFEKAQFMYASGKLDSTFYLINQLGGFDSEKEFEMYYFREKLVSETKTLGEKNFISGNFPEAIYFLELLDKHTEVKELSLKEALALAYRRTGQIEESIHVFTQLLMRSYKKIFVYVQLAEIYRDNYGDYEQARFYFEKANQSAKMYYEGVYGKAYNVILTGSILPDYHFSLYTGLADIYLRLDQPQKAISVTEWNKQVWPNKEENFIIAAEGYRQLGKEVLARNELKKFANRNQ